MYLAESWAIKKYDKGKTKNRIINALVKRSITRTFRQTLISTEEYLPKYRIDLSKPIPRKKFKDFIK
jgi:hypothetical protein